ncbi:MAG: hypothetical protein QOJ39_354 [Candidatus Eremiobacteraeota bacterium]|jgi:hypothetical protein|nr:hypothetical protein [Candidatus Eremiobacteraeota bacterium]
MERVQWQVVYECADGSTGANYCETREEAELVSRLLLGHESGDALPAGFMWVRPSRAEVVSTRVELRSSN